MPRVIDADNTVRTICGYYCGCERDECDSDDPCEVVAFIEDAPTVSPDEVRGVGEWEKETICYSRCSNCKKLIKTAELVEYKASDGQGSFLVVPSIEKYVISFCPNCGAKMEETDDA